MGDITVGVGILVLEKMGRSVLNPGNDSSHVCAYINLLQNATLKYVGFIER